MKVSQLMTEYFKPTDENIPSISNEIFGIPQSNMPISPEKITWQVEEDPQRLVLDI